MTQPVLNACFQKGYTLIASLSAVPVQRCSLLFGSSSAFYCLPFIVLLSRTRTSCVVGTLPFTAAHCACATPMSQITGIGDKVIRNSFLLQVTTTNSGLERD